RGDAQQPGLLVMAAPRIPAVALVVGKVLPACVPLRDAELPLRPVHVPADEIGRVLDLVPPRPEAARVGDVVVPRPVQRLRIAIGRTPAPRRDEAQRILSRRL